MEPGFACFGNSASKKMLGMERQEAHTEWEAPLPRPILDPVKGSEASETSLHLPSICQLQHDCTQ